MPRVEVAGPRRVQAPREPVLQGRGQLRRAGPAGRSAARLAASLDVSVRTIKRDISALQQGGFPVWARPGPGGGYVVDAAATLPPVTVTPAEVSGLAAAVAAHRGQPFDGPARAALAKILGVMDPAARDRATALGARLWIDDVAQGPPARARRAVEQALEEGRVLSLRYRDRGGEVRATSVDPVLLAHTQGTWFLVGLCRSDDALRWFRLGDVEAAHVTSVAARVIPVEAVGTPPPTAHPVADL
ncbi:transcriptional regulator [Actinotalea ferrariae CF5-4]|uniref:Transcriptional regulator n=1 Tax=Actinotalea ferrariae CF5-4 TaxID=948458 RepID=A0A021VQ78_9CELL|nr:WYL domain-containing protein [Actinotalea ferrariae]EYR63329.1 transcriptional regulator [Actinotalea ferrariae CF5-4]